MKALWKRLTRQRAPVVADYAVLMVCMGNICRSPTAEAVLVAKLAQAGLAGRVRVDSAGTHSYHIGAPPDHRAQLHARQRGYDLSGLRARRVQAADFERFDLLLAMDRENLEGLLEIAPEGTAQRARLLLSFAAGPGGVSEVPDPYYGTDNGFEQVLDLVERACDGLVGHIVSELRRGLPGSGQGGPPSVP